METNNNENNPNNPSATISAAFPAPPPFYKSFTPGNLALVAAHQEETRHAASSSPSQSANLLPEDARHLIPPPPPRDGKYRSFGVLHDVCQPPRAQSFLLHSLNPLTQTSRSPFPLSRPHPLHCNNPNHPHSHDRNRRRRNASLPSRTTSCSPSSR